MSSPYNNGGPLLAVMKPGWRLAAGLTSEEMLALCWITKLMQTDDTDHGATVQTAATSHPAVERLLSNMPSGVRATFLPAQRDAIEASLNRRKAAHKIDFRVSIPLLGERFYVVFLLGTESRSLERLRSEGQLTFGRLAFTYSVIATTIVIAMLFSGALAIYSIGKLLESDDCPQRAIACMHVKAG